MFHFKEFSIRQDHSAMKVSTDGVIFGSWIKVRKDSTILDIGTGTGLLALMMAQKNQSICIHGVEINSGAYEDALFNVERSIFTDQITLHHNSIQEFAEKNSIRFDQIVSNPPYFNAGMSSENSSRAMARHHEKLNFEELFSVVSRLLVKEGLFSVIFPKEQKTDIVDLANKFDLNIYRSCNVRANQYSSKGRIMLEFLNGHCSLEEEKELQIYNNGSSDYTEEFVELTKSYYL